MLKTGILNPKINALLSRIRHTNRLVIADRGFPYWPNLETVDIALIDDVPLVLQVLRAIRSNFVFGNCWMAGEFLRENSEQVTGEFAKALEGIPLAHEAHALFKQRASTSLGLIRTGDTIPYANIILESA